MRGLTDEEITAIRSGDLAGFAAAEAALLRMTDAMADTPSSVSEELYDKIVIPLNLTRPGTADVP